MGLIDEIILAAREGKFGVLLEGESLLIPVSNANSFLDWISGRYYLLGVEGFTYDGRKLTPLTDCIVDYSDGDPEGGIEFHRQILADDSFQKAQFLEFVISAQVVDNA